MHEPLVRDFRSLGGKIAILGGTFDPVHTGHVAMGEAIIAAAGVDAVVYVPAKQNPLKHNAPIGSDQERIEMLRLALRSNNRLFVSAIETERSGSSYTVETLRQVKDLARYGAELSFVCGADQLSEFHKWKDVAGIFSLAAVFVLGRDKIGAGDVEQLAAGLPPELREKLRGNFIPFELPSAATEIRARLLAGESPESVGTLAPEVASFIRSNGLYRKKN